MTKRPRLIFRALAKRFRNWQNIFQSGRCLKARLGIIFVAISAHSPRGRIT